MSSHIMKCGKCSSYTLHEICCGEKTLPVKPPKFSPDDKYAEYRRTVKSDELKKKGLL